MDHDSYIEYKRREMDRHTADQRYMEEELYRLSVRFKFDVIIFVLFLIAGIIVWK